MMLIRDKIKPNEYKQLYEDLEYELIQLLEKNNWQIIFDVLYTGNNSTYGQVDELLTDFIYQSRNKYDWINAEKDLRL